MMDLSSTLPSMILKEVFCRSFIVMSREFRWLVSRQCPTEGTLTANEAPRRAPNDRPHDVAPQIGVSGS
jgi:hypothetical protein